MYINKKIRTSSRFARLRAVSKSSTFFYPLCIKHIIHVCIYRVYQKKVDNFETALNVANRLEV